METIHEQLAELFRFHAEVAFMEITALMEQEASADA